MTDIHLDTDSNKAASADDIGAYFYYHEQNKKLGDNSNTPVISKNAAVFAQAMIDEVDRHEGAGEFLRRNQSDTDAMDGDCYFGFHDIDRTLAFAVLHQDTIVEIIQDIVVNTHGTTLKKWTRNITLRSVHDFDLIMVLNCLTVGSNILNSDQIPAYEVLILTMLDEVIFWSLFEYENLQDIAELDME